MSVPANVEKVSRHATWFVQAVLEMFWMNENVVDNRSWSHNEHVMGKFAKKVFGYQLNGLSVQPHVVWENNSGLHFVWCRMTKVSIKWSVMYFAERKQNRH